MNKKHILSAHAPLYIAFSLLLFLDCISIIFRAYSVLRLFIILDCVGLIAIVYAQRISCEFLFWRIILGFLVLPKLIIRVIESSVEAKVLYGLLIVALILSGILLRKQYLRNKPTHYQDTSGGRVYLSIRYTGIGIVILECLALGIIAWNFPALLHPPLPYHYEKLQNYVLNRYPPSPGKKAIIVAGSSPAYVDLERNRPFPVLLREHYRNKYTVISFDQGGLTTPRLTQLIHDIFMTRSDVAGIIVYAGHQDINEAATHTAFRHITDSGPGLSIITAVFTRSDIMKVILTCIRSGKSRNQNILTAARCDEILTSYKTGLQDIIRDAHHHGVHVILVTQILDTKKMGGQNISFWRKQNELIRKLGRKYPYVSIVDFNAAVARRDFRQYDNNEPYETVPGTRLPGDPFHLGTHAHILLAKMLIQHVSMIGL